MKAVWNQWKEALRTINFDGLRCFVKGDPSFQEIMGAFRRQKEIDTTQT